MTLEKLGFLGLGLMGWRMAKNLAAKGFEVTVWNRTRAKADALAKEAGVKVASTPAELAAGVDAYCTCVADPPALEEVFFGEVGLLSASRPGQLFVDFSTVSPDLTRKLEASCAARGIAFVEAPVTGSKVGAEKATLLMMVGAEHAALKEAQPILDAVGQKVIHCGPVGAGSQVKLAANALVALMLQGFSEGMLLAQASGLDPRKLLEVVQASGFRSPYFDFKGEALLRRDAETHFAIDLMFKDLSLFLDSAARHRVPTPCAAAVREVYQLARASGRGEQDIVTTIGALEDLRGTRIGAPSPSR